MFDQSELANITEQRKHIYPNTFGMAKISFTDFSFKLASSILIKSGVKFSFAFFQEILRASEKQA